jgi:hypothetical protein
LKNQIKQIKQINNLILKRLNQSFSWSESSLSRYRIHIMNIFESFKSNESKMCLFMYSNVVEDENDALNKILEELNRNNKKASK